MIADDEYDVAILIKQFLQTNGLKVSVFTDPITALEDFKINCKNCGLILSDIRMLGMNGYELVRKAKEIDKQIKVVQAFSRSNKRSFIMFCQISR
jgi:two-component system, cell cycle sensor histidine kinase and response regulator CckA